MKRAGGIRGREYTPTVDGNFDRISTEIDPGFGTEDEYQAMVRRARDNGAVIIGDIIPGHSGKGADFRLAERRLRRLPGPLPHGGDPADGLEPAPRGPGRQGLGQPRARGGGRAQGARLHRRAAPAHHLLRAGRQGDRLVGHRRRRRASTARAAAGSTCTTSRKGSPPSTGSIPPSPRSGWSRATPLHSLGTLGERMLRLDANGFLGIEVGPEQRPRLVRGASALGHLQPAHRRPGAQARRLHLPGAEPHPRGHQGDVARGRRSLLRLRHPPRPTTTPSSPATPSSCDSCSICRGPTRSIPRASSTRSRTTTSSPSSWCTSGPGTRTRPSPSAASR